MSNSMILFPSRPFERRQVDPSFEEEYKAAVDAGFKVGLVDIDNDDYVHANIPALYRGWILKLIVKFYDYINSYNFPEWYSQVYPSTPKSTWIYGTAELFLEDGKFKAIINPGGTQNINILDYIGTKPLIIKDWIKSRKHEWLDACFIPDPNDTENLIRVITNFINGQGDDLVGGLVFREYAKLKIIGNHPKSELPMANEHRFFVFKGQIFYSAPYWNCGWYTEGLGIDEPANYPDKKVIIDLIPRIKSRFFAIDVAEKEDGSWIVVEVNDGGTAGIPEGGNVYDFYKALRELF